MSLVNQKHLNVDETRCDLTRLNGNPTVMTNAAQGHRAAHGMQGCFWCPRQASRFEGLRVAPGAWHTGDRCFTISPKQCLGNCNRDRYMCHVGVRLATNHVKRGRRIQFPKGSTRHNTHKMSPQHVISINTVD